MSPDTLSLVVCTYRRPEAIDRLLTAVEAQSRPPEEVIVIDASPNLDTSAVVAEHHNRQAVTLRYVAVGENERGLTRQRNRGVREATGSLIAFLDDDTIPAPDYFAEIVSTFRRRPDAIGVGGNIDGATWRPAPPLATDRWFRWDGWERPDEARWRLRQTLGLASDRPPGYLPPSGHGRPVGYLPPSGEDYLVEFIMGGASTWRRTVFERHSFSPLFEGYGLYEDLDFCIDVAPSGPLYLSTAATLRHEHDPAARPANVSYGVMVVRNGWYVWRRRWPDPAVIDRVRWWATTVLLTVVRLTGIVGAHPEERREESWGRLVGILLTVRCEWSREYRGRLYGCYSRLR